VLFLGSNIGNLEPREAAAFLKSIRGALGEGDHLLLGADLVKPAAAFEQAYDDQLGVTAAFNRNLLVRMNRELGADFDLEGFSHQALWNAGERRVEMHLAACGGSGADPRGRFDLHLRCRRRHLDREFLQVHARGD
jgi:uncharacterized SAM-dependent methyltransferase